MHLERLLLGVAVASLALASVWGMQGAATLTPFEARGKWGYRDAGGKVVIAPQYDVVQPFSPEGIAAVVDAGGWAYIDRQARVLIRPFVLDNGPDYFRQGLARFVREGRLGFFDRHGKVDVPARFSFAQPFSEGLAAVCAGCKEVPEGEHKAVRGGQWGFIDRQGALVIPLKFERAESFESGRARVLLDGQWRYINARGDVQPD